MDEEIKIMEMTETPIAPPEAPPRKKGRPKGSKDKKPRCTNGYHKQRNPP